MSKCAILAFLQTLSIELSVPPKVLPAIIMQESSFQPDALSHKNAKGLMQITPIAVKEVLRQVKLKRLPKICNVSGDPFDPRVNMTLGACYFKLMLMEFDKNVRHSLAAYNSGSYRVLQHIKEGRELPPETRDYIKKIPKHMAAVETTCKKG